jgi:taspase (threonine aspartase 1)
MVESEEYCVAVHGGAGFHHPDNDKRTKKALRLFVPPYILYLV